MKTALDRLADLPDVGQSLYDSAEFDAVTAPLTALRFRAKQRNTMEIERHLRPGADTQLKNKTGYRLAASTGPGEDAEQRLQLRLSNQY